MDEKKVREAIERMCKMRDMYNSTLCSLPPKTREKSEYNNYVDTFLAAIEALEKQLPKKPRENKIRGNCLLAEMMNERQNTSCCWDC